MEKIENTENMQPNSWKKKFFTIMFGQSFSLIGSAAVQFALIWWLASETSSPLMLSLAGIAAFIPQMLLGPFVGVIVDRLKRKNIVIVADMANGLIATAFSIAFLVTTPPYWSVCVILLMRGFTSVFHTPAIQAVIPSLVPEDKLMKANSWGQFMQSGSFMLGPVIGAALYGILPLWIILLSDLVGALFASICLAVTKIHETKPKKTEKSHYFRELKEGFKTLTSDKKLLILLVSSTLSMIFFMPIATLFPLMTSSYFGLGAIYGSVVEFVYALGMLIISALLANVTKVKRKLLFASFGMLTMGIAIFFAGILPATLWAFWIFAVLCFFTGASGNIYNIPTVTYMQETIDRTKLGRVFSLMGAMMSFSMPIGLIMAGPIAETLGVNIWFLICGIAVIVITTISIFMLSQKSRYV